MIDRIRRRLLLTWLFLAPLFAGARPVSAFPTATAAPVVDPFDALPAYLDTLIPEHLGPSATALGVDDRIREAASRDVQFGKLVTAGCDWLDAKARSRGATSFERLCEDERIAVVESAEGASPTSGEWVFYQATRAMAFKCYYADSRSWSGIGFVRAPQPAGYMDYASRPTKPTR